MAKTVQPHRLTLRLDAELYLEAQSLARAQFVSLNTLIQESIRATLLRSEKQKRFDDYSLLGQDLEECNLTFSAAAQAEVMLSDD